MPRHTCTVDNSLTWDIDVLFTVTQYIHLLFWGLSDPSPTPPHAMYGLSVLCLIYQATSLSEPQPGARKSLSRPGCVGPSETRLWTKQVFLPRRIHSWKERPGVPQTGSPQPCMELFNPASRSFSFAIHPVLSSPAAQDCRARFEEIYWCTRLET